MCLDTTIDRFRKLWRIKAAVGLGHRNGFRKRDLEYATSLIRRVCEIAGPVHLVDEIREELVAYGVIDAVQDHNDDVLFGWLAECISYQGISDSIASRYIEEHGSVDAVDIRRGLDRASCPKLASHWHFEDCGYRKTNQSCNMPRQFRRCPLPRHDLRNGNLNRGVYSLYLFMRDVAGGDLVAWIDRRLATASQSPDRSRARHLSDALILPLNHVFGVSDKLWNMILASLLLAGDPNRALWVEAGAGMIAIDSLVHNWLHRAGILSRLGAEHPYGPSCYGARGCADIIEAVAPNIDAKGFNRSFPSSFPRFVQNAIWRFCAGAAMDRCNGNRINDRERCQDWGCPLFGHCARIALNPIAAAPLSVA